MYCTSHFSISNHIFEILCPNENLFRSISIVSFDDGLTNSLTSSTNSFIPDFI